MVIEDALNVFENALRDLVERLLRERDGDEWLANAGVSAERLQIWNDRLKAEPKRRPGGDVDPRSIYYADFFDVVGIVKRNWELFKPCFEDRKRFDVYTDRLSAFRDPDAHSRALRPFEEQLVLGMTGELRQDITVFLSSGAGGPEREHFARIEEIRDSFGARQVGKLISGWPGDLRSSNILRPGDVVSFSGRAWDPEGKPLKWRLYLAARKEFIQQEGADMAWDWHVNERDIGEASFITFHIYSARSYSRELEGHDDQASFFYTVLPLS